MRKVESSSAHLESASGPVGILLDVAFFIGPALSRIEWLDVLSIAQVIIFELLLILLCRVSGVFDYVFGVDWLSLPPVRDIVAPSSSIQIACLRVSISPLLCWASGLFVVLHHFLPPLLLREYFELGLRLVLALGHALTHQALVHALRLFVDGVKLGLLV